MALKSHTNRLIAGAAFLTIIVVLAYFIVRISLYVISDYAWYERLLAGILVVSEGFLLLHSFGYFLNVLHVSRNEGKPAAGHHPPLKELKEFPPVAIIVSSYKEPLAVIENTLTCFYNLAYPNKFLYFLDDTRYDLPKQDPEVMKKYRADVDRLCASLGINVFRRKWHGAKAGMINDFLLFVEGAPPEGFEFTPHMGRPAEGKEKYVMIFDADMNPFPDTVEHLVKVMEANPQMAFIQTPQYYTNFEFNRVARASGLQQAVFYEYICEGKSMQDAMFCCGTNVMFRREALADVGGFDETSVTEDFATSLRFHMKGWHSAYLNKVCAFGMGPEDLGGYFKQQFRWALGTVGLFRVILLAFLKNPRALPAAKWWEYFLSGSYYFVGWVFCILMICPVIYLLFNIPSFFAYPDVFFLFFAPYFIMALTMFMLGLQLRGYRFKDIFLGVLLNAICFPVFMKASLQGIMGVRGSFGITPKGQSFSLPLTGLWPQLLVALLSFIGLVWGLNAVYYIRHPVSALLVNSLWCFYHILILATVFYFNFPEEDPS